MSVSTFNTLTGGAPGPAFLLSLDGEVLAANLAAAGLVDCDPLDLVGRHLVDLVDNTPQHVERHLDRWARSGQPLPGSLRWRRPDGSTQMTRCWGSFVRATAEQPAALTVHCTPDVGAASRFVALNRTLEDLTTAYHRLQDKARQLEDEIQERRRVEERLRDSEERFRVTFEQAAVGIALIAPDLRFLRVNQQLCDILGYTRQELLARTVDDITIPQDRDRTREEIGRLGSGQREPMSVDRRFRHKDGSAIWATATSAVVRTATGEPDYFITVVQDITARKLMEEEQARQATALEHAADSILVTDTQGHILYVNPAFERISGYPRAEVLGQTPDILRSGKHPARFYAELWATLARGEVWTSHVINRRKDGTLFEEEASISPVRTADGTTIGYVGVNRDVTIQMRLERQLLQSQKMEAVGTLAGGIAHDFNNILAPILGFGDLVLETLRPGSEEWSNQQMLLEAGQRAKALVQQILALSRPGQGERRPVAIGRIIKEATRLLRASIPATIEIRVEIEPDCGDVLADPTQIHQVVMNLCTNAAHAMRDTTGTLEVRLRHVRLDSVTVPVGSGLEPGRFVQLEVQDTGHGMGGEVLERVFEPYFTAKVLGEGSGLGLAVVHGIVKSHGGYISAQSEPGEGALFRVYLPRLGDTSVVPARVDRSPPKTGSARILVVDDESAIAHLFERMLATLGYRVTSVTSSTEAWSIIKAAPSRIDLVITDMTMPQMTGAELAKKILAVRPDMPIVLTTGFHEAIDEKSAAALGIRAFVMKPFVRRQLAAVVDSALRPAD